MGRDLQTIITGLHYGEAPRWHDGRLWLVDFYSHEVLSFAEDGSDRRVEATVPQQPSGIGWLPDGRLLVVSMRDSQILRREPSGVLVQHADVSAHTTGHLNDMVVDARGRAYAGHFGYDLMGGGAPALASLVRVDPPADGGGPPRASVAAEGLNFPNGSALTADGRTLLVAETFGARITAFDVAADGGLGGRRVWAEPGGAASDEVDGTEETTPAFRPDGVALDAEGALWVADAGGGRLLRLREGGEVLDEVHMGGDGVFACMLGGADGKTLYACVAPDFHEEKRRAAKEGRVVALRVDVPHAGLP